MNLDDKSSIKSFRTTKDQLQQINFVTFSDYKNSSAMQDVGDENNVAAGNEDYGGEAGRVIRSGVGVTKSATAGSKNGARSEENQSAYLNI